MNLTISGKIWDSADEAAREWLPKYIRDRFNLALFDVNNYCLYPLRYSLLSSNLWNESNMNLEVVLHPTYDWGYAGLTSPGDGINTKVETSWNLEYDSYVNRSRHTILFHEFGKLIMFIKFGAKNGWWSNYGNGKFNDLLLQGMKIIADRNWHGDMKFFHKGIEV